MPRRSSRYRRRYGQHFLNSPRIAERIVEFARVDGEVVCEIGSGKGMLTVPLAKRARRVYAIEIDPALFEGLRRKSASNVMVIHDDFLKVNIADFGRCVVVGNIPYSITTGIFDKLVQQKEHIHRAIVMVQREYGERLRAPVGHTRYGALTMYVNYHFTISRGMTVPPRYFTPRPMVSSVVLGLEKKTPEFAIRDDDAFFDFVRTVFRYRRKSLRNALIQATETVPVRVRSGIMDKRPQDVTLEELYSLYEECCA